MNISNDIYYTLCKECQEKIFEHMIKNAIEMTDEDIKKHENLLKEIEK